MVTRAAGSRARRRRALAAAAALACALGAAAGAAAQERPREGGLEGGLAPAPLPGGPAPSGAGAGALGGPGAQRPETPEVKALREALTAEPATEARAKRLAAMGPEAWALLLATPSLAGLADEVVDPALAAMPDERLAALGARLARNEPSLVPKLARRMTAGPRPPLLAAFVAPAAGGDDDADLDGPSRLSRLLAEAAVRDGTTAFEQLLYGPEAVTGAARQTIAAALGASSRDDAIEALVPLLDEDEDTALAAVQALQLCPDGKGAAIPPLVRALGSPAPLVRRAAAQALGRLRAAEAADALLAMAQDPEADRPRRRAAAPAGAAAPGDAKGASASGATGPGGASGADEETLHADPSAAPPPLPLPPGAVVLTAQVEATRALREIAGAALPEEPAALARALEAMRAEADKRLPLLLAEVDSGDPQAALAAARKLPQYGVRRDRVRPVLLRMLGAGDAPARALAASTLGAMRETLAIPALIDALGDRDPGVWEAALAALRGITGKDLPARAELWRRRNVRR